jgi:hypothetical protein
MRLLVAALIDGPINVVLGASGDYGGEDAKRYSRAELHGAPSKVGESKGLKLNREQAVR